ncbi:hypothetical protein HMPREF1983_00546 [Gemella bergeri ATCC 700627]|uniref:Uncharacterized protein n=1 Tax=Gemella bergeri ATCC 700627 TaxID=1321820 RepID=U2S153_9BACL|nr:hypothetical protein HMPREF1983_00546 [Gemella bergeri ATCC 700627]
MFLIIHLYATGYLKPQFLKNNKFEKCLIFAKKIKICYYTYDKNIRK